MLSARHIQALLLTCSIGLVLSPSDAIGNDRGLGIPATEGPSDVAWFVNRLVQQGATRIRYPIFLNPQRPTVGHWFEMIDAAVNTASPAGVTIAVVMFDPNAHSDAKKIRDIKKFTGGWEAIAKRYRNYPPHAISFELLNEPVRWHGPKNSTWRTVATKAAQRIRAVNGRHRILYAPVNMNANTPDRIRGISQPEAKPLDGIADQELVFHMWPWVSGNRVQSPCDSERHAGLPDCSNVKRYTRSHYDALLNKVAKVAAYGNHYRVPVYISETGISADHPDAVRFLADVTTICDMFDVNLNLHDYNPVAPWNYQSRHDTWTVVATWLAGF